MSMKGDTVSLRSALDILWQEHPGDSAIAAQLLDCLDWHDWTVVAGWDTAATFGPVVGTLQLDHTGSITIGDAWGRVFLQLRLVHAQESDGSNALISYDGSSYRIFAIEDSPFMPQGHLVHDPRATLMALQLIRDYVDSALLLPPELRDAEIARLSSAAKVDESHFRRLATWFPQIEEYALGAKP